VPLIESGGLASRFELLSSRDLFEPMDFLCSDPSAFDQFARAVADTGRPAHFARIPADSPAIAAFRNAYARGWVRTVPAAGSPYIELSDKWREPEGCYAADWRSDLRRARRRAAGMGGIACKIFTPTPEQCPALLDQAYRVESASWKRESGSALRVDKIRGAFFLRLAELASRAAMLRVCFLYVGADVAAMQIAVEQGNRFYLLKIGYDERYSRCSPGTLLVLETLRYAASRGLFSYEFLGSNEDWIKRWTKLSRPTISLSAYPRAWKGAVAIVSDAKRAMLRRLRLSVQARLRGAPVFLRSPDAAR
jgi:CelD/BcsL family acetyltransferase involved in cellulose biosynthesis